MSVEAVGEIAEEAVLMFSRFMGSSTSSQLGMLRQVARVSED